jgi:hypothetical protein
MQQSSSSSSTAQSEAAGIPMQQSSSSSTEIHSNEDMLRELWGAPVDRPALITHSHTARRAICDILEGCERKRKIAVLSEILEGIRTQGLQTEGHSQVKRNQALTPTLEKSFFGNEPHFFGSHATTMEKKNEDEQQLLGPCENLIQEESEPMCAVVEKKALKITFVVGVL